MGRSRYEHHRWIVKSVHVRQGYTLMEVLVVVGIIGILLAILLPAVQASRDVADRLTCQNNMRQLGLALHTFHDYNRTLPPGHDNRLRPWSTAEYPGYQPYWSWMALIMPYYEKSALYDEAERWARSGDTAGNRWWPWGNRTGTPPNPAFGTLNNVVQCPTDRRTFVIQDALRVRVALTSYLGVSGIRGDPDGDRSGVLTSNERFRFADIIDGTSNTLIIGERPPSADFQEGWWFAGSGFDGSGSGDVVLGARDQSVAEFRNCPPSRVGLQPGESGDLCTDATFWSFHKGGANFAMADGSIRFLNYAADEILPQLATRNGRETFPDGL